VEVHNAGPNRQNPIPMNPPRLLVIDNYDSFTYNLVQMFMPYPLDIAVVRADAISLDALAAALPDYVLISPGPRDPQHAGISVPLIRRFHRNVPILGVCLGLQSLNEAFDGRTVRAPVPVHGKTSRIHHDGLGLFAGMPSPFSAARYHSLVAVPSVGGPLVVTARSEDGVIMGLSHPAYPLHGVQFHPESFITEYGDRLIDQFLRLGPLSASPDLGRPTAETPSVHRGKTERGGYFASKTIQNAETPPVHRCDTERGGHRSAKTVQSAETPPVRHGDTEWVA
jgi:anthranilate synthase component II